MCAGGRPSGSARRGCGPCPGPQPPPAAPCARRAARSLLRWCRAHRAVSPFLQRRTGDARSGPGAVKASGFWAAYCTGPRSIDASLQPSFRRGQHRLCSTLRSTMVQPCTPLLGPLNVLKLARYFATRASQHAASALQQQTAVASVHSTAAAQRLRAVSPGLCALRAVTHNHATP